MYLDQASVEGERSPGGALVPGQDIGRAGPIKSVFIGVIPGAVGNADHAGRIVFQMAQVAVPREVFAAILEQVIRLRTAPG